MYQCGNSEMLLLSAIVHVHAYIYNVPKLVVLIMKLMMCTYFLQLFFVFCFFRYLFTLMA